MGYYSHILAKGLPPAQVILFLSHVTVYSMPKVRRHRRGSGRNGQVYAMQPFCTIESPATPEWLPVSTLDLAGLGKASRLINDRKKQFEFDNSGSMDEADDLLENRMALEGGFGRRPLLTSDAYRTFSVNCFGTAIEGDCILRLRDAEAPKRDVAFACFNPNMLLHVAQTQTRLKDPAAGSRRGVGMGAGAGRSQRTLADDCSQLIAHTFKVSAATRREQSERLRLSASDRASSGRLSRDEIALHIGANARMSSPPNSRRKKMVSHAAAIDSIMLSAERRAIDAEARGEDPEELSKVCGVAGTCHIPRHGIDVANRDRACQKYSADFAIELHFCTARQAERLQGALQAYI